MLELLPWLNLLLLPTLAGIWGIAVRLTRIDVKMQAHEELDKYRFETIDKRLSARDN